MLLGLGAVRLGIDEGHHIVLVTDCDGLTVGAPAYVDVLTYKRIGEARRAAANEKGGDAGRAEQDWDLWC